MTIIYIFNLEITTDRNLLEMDIPLRRLLVLMFARKGQRQKEGKTLVFLDEIQCSPVSISKLRYLYEDMPEVHVIAAGSLLENIVDVNVSFPVGRLDFLPVRPCSFKEFLGAMGKESQIEIMHYPELTQTFHDEYMAFFHQYCVVGGMPEAVQQFVDSEDMLSVDTIYSRLLRGYMDDVEKYAKKSRITEVVRHVIRYGWGYAGSRVTLGGFANSDYRSRDIELSLARYR